MLLNILCLDEKGLLNFGFFFIIFKFKEECFMMRKYCERNIWKLMNYCFIVVIEFYVIGLLFVYEREYCLLRNNYYY